MQKKMDKNNDQVSIDINNLAASLTGKFHTLNPLSKACCIYRIPQKIRMFDHQNLYTPTTLSIGPLHHGRLELQPMEDHKLRYLQNFLKRTPTRLVDFLSLIKKQEPRLRSCYAETIQLQSQGFVEMILLDSVFLIEILIRWNFLEFDSDEDRIFGKQRMIIDIRYDIWFLENQIPLFILQDLYNLADLQRLKTVTLSELTSGFLEYLYKPLSIDSQIVEKHFQDAKHLLDLLRLCLQPSRIDIDNNLIYSPIAPTITELRRAGVKFKVGISSSNVFDIRFQKGILEFPKMRSIGNYTGHLLRNLQVFERFHCGCNYVNDFVIMLSFLINDPRDVDLLVGSGIIEHRGCDSEELSSLVQELSKNARMKHNRFYYRDLVDDLNRYCKCPWNRRRANLIQNYFNTPWASISVIAAAVLLLLTFVQTICSVIGLLN